MAKKSSVEKNKRREKLVKKYSATRAKLKALVIDETLSLEERFEAQKKLAKLPRNGSKGRIRNRCEISGRPRAYFRKFRMSRIALRDFASAGLLPGVKKASW
ncbi:MAG: 30S ribosomal protein S14 [Sphingobacteriia bacterium]|nr:30S ribosomal protein S14 [Sphingobacteriia bacterium]